MDVRIFLVHKNKISTYQTAPDAVFVHICAAPLLFPVSMSTTQAMKLASAPPSSSSTVFSTTLCAPRSSSISFFHSRHHHLCFQLPTLRKCNLNEKRSAGKNYRDERVIYKCSAVEVENENNIDDEACELVNGVELSIGEGDDNIEAYLFKAVKNNNGTGVLLLSDIFGFQDSATRDFAYQVACHGYNVLVPDLFRGDPWGKGRTGTLAFEQWLASQDPQRVAKDIATSTKWMVDEFTAAGLSNKLGVIGFCFGGGRVIDVLAADQAGCFSAAVSFYGTRMNLSAIPKIQVPVLFISGDNDPLCPVSVLREFEKSIGKGSRVVIFNGRGHGFAHRPGSPEDDEDAEQAFTLMRNWLHDGLLVKN